MPRMHLTAAQVNKLPTLEKGQVLYRDTKLTGFGLCVGATAKSYFVEKRVDGRNVRHTLGRHGQITADEARKKAGTMLGEMTAGTDPNLLKQEKAAERSAQQERKAASAQYTVRALCERYVDHQIALGKQSAVDAKGIFAKWVFDSEFADIPARDLTPKQATTLIRAVVEAGHKRTAAKARAYLRAAYGLAAGADTNPQAPSALIKFGIEHNPIAATAQIKNSTGTRDATLTEEELGETLRLLRAARKEQHDDGLAAIELSVLLGGQRLAQTLRVTSDDVDMDARTVTLWDSKGRREKARRHTLPLTKTAAALLDDIRKVRGRHFFGEQPIPTIATVAARKGVALLAQAQANIAARQAGKQAPRPKLEPRDLRRTAETMLAAMGISRDVRAQLLSHGLGGVQMHSYERHAFMDEKKAALEAWEAHLQALVDRKPRASNVKRLRHA